VVYSLKEVIKLADEEFILKFTPGPCSLNRSPKKNWVENAGGLPNYTCHVARALHEKRGFSISHAIATAVSQNKKRIATGKTSGTKARAAGATAEWEAKRAKSKAKTAAKLAKTFDESPVILDDMRDPDFDLNLAEFQLDVPIAKIDEDKRLAFGWASVAKRKDGTIISDLQGDEIRDLDAMEDVAYKFVTDCRDGGEMHVRKGVAQLVESFMVTPEKLEKMGLPEGSLPVGWWVGYRVNDEDVWKGVKDGKYTQFSVHGRGRRTILED